MLFIGHIGMWLSLVEHYVRDVGAAGSNPVIPTKNGKQIALLCGLFFYCQIWAEIILNQK